MPWQYFYPCSELPRRLEANLEMRGFSIVEMAVVIMVIAMLTALGMISFSSVIPKRLEAEARKIVSDLCYAREMAVSKHNNYIVDFDITNEFYTVYEGSINPNNLIERQKLEIDLVSVTPLPNRIQFNYPFGIAEDKQIDLNYRGKTKRITVFGNTGYVKMQ